MTPRGVVVVVLALAGLFFATAAAVGVLRLPDFYARAHATAKTDTVAPVLTLAAAGVAFGLDAATLKAAFLLVFLLVTNPTAAHAVARAGYERGVDPWSARDGGEES